MQNSDAMDQIEILILIARVENIADTRLHLQSVEFGAPPRYGHALRRDVHRVYFGTQLCKIHRFLAHPTAEIEYALARYRAEEARDPLPRIPHVSWCLVMRHQVRLNVEIVFVTGIRNICKK